MLENGLGQACNQWTRKMLSPTLSLAKIGDNEAENDQFLEVHYHNRVGESDRNVSPLCEVMSHMHNSALNLEAQSQMGHEVSDMDGKKTEVANPVVQSDAPESPSIPRDEPSFHVDADKAKIGHNNDKNVPGQKPETLHTPAKDTSNISPTFMHKSLFSPSEKPPLARRSSSNDSDKLSVHVSHRVKKDCAGDADLEADKKRDLEPSQESPLANVKDITHIEAVQCNAKNIQDVGDINLNSKGDLSLQDTVALPSPIEAIDELDSPESILEIDSEDCFSWEQDRLQLTLHEETSDLKDLASVGDNNANRVDPKETSKSLLTKDPPSVDSAECESVSSDTTSTTASLHSPTGSKEKLNSGSKRGSTFKNKLSAALNKVGSKSKSKLTSNASSSSLEAIDGTVSLVQDKLGHPLAIYTNVSRKLITFLF